MAFDGGLFVWQSLQNEILAVRHSSVHDYAAITSNAIKKTIYTVFKSDAVEGCAATRQKLRQGQSPLQ